jgi:tetratricopeptide (TPR) repeat protein
VALFREVGDRRGAATSLRLLGEAALHQKDYEKAVRCAEESLAIFRDLGDRWAIGYALRLLAGIALAQDDRPGAHRRYAESLAMHREHGDRLGIVKCLEGLVCVLVADEQFEKAARLLGSAEQMRARIGAPRTRVEVPGHEQCMTRLRDALQVPRLETLLEEGRGKTEDAMLAQIGQLENEPTR